MKRLSEILLLVIYVMAVLMITTVEVKAYIYRIEENIEDEQQDLEEVIANKAELVTGNAMDGADEDDLPDADIYAGEDGLPDEDIYANEDDLPGEDIYAGEDNLSDADIYAGEGDLSDTDIYAGEDDLSDADIYADEDDLPDEDISVDEGELRNAVTRDAELSEDAENSENEAKTSYEITLEVNRADIKRITENQYDFSKIKIACLGDSITCASNLEDEENYEQYAYPSVLKELLGAEEVYNMGIGGSSIGRYWFEPIVERYTDIPEDTDIIIVMGGYNDGFSATEAEFGSLDERAYRTFCGDLDELMRGLKEDYPEAVVFFATPLANSLHSALMSRNEKLLEQEEYVNVIGILSEEYGFEFLDLYNLDFLNSNDIDVVNEYIPDGTHGNHAGYRVLAEHFASEIVKYYNGRAGAKSIMEMEEYEREISAI